MLVQGLAPSLPSHRPAAAATWWSAGGSVTDGRLVIDRLEEGRTPIEAPCGVAAPLSLPDEFVAWLELDEPYRRALARWTPSRLFAAARAFAARREKGHKHPPRDVEESVSALDRRRLARFHAALAIDSPLAFEVDVPCFLQARGLPSTGWSGSDMRAIARRATILEGLDVAVAARDFAIASAAALEAIVCCTAAAHRAHA
ncbi:MAG: hypothetical protein AAGD14_10135 [Planctomycetota bacterium]